MFVAMVVLALALAVAAVPASAQAAPVSSLSVGDLELNQVEDPMGIDDPRPTLSWKLTANRRNQLQRAYQVVVASSRTLLARGEGDLWDTGKVASSQSINVEYAGAELGSRTEAYWKVRVWDEADRSSAWSRPARWEMGLLESSDWNACWVTDQRWLAPPAEWPTRMPLFARTFSLDRPVAEARLYAAGLGLYEARLNGAKVGDAVLEPADSDPRKRVRYTTYDITDRLRRGANTLGFMLGNGVYNAPPTPGRYNVFTDSNNMPRGKTAPLKLIAQLEVTYADGSRETIATDDSWRTALGPTTFSGWFGGEDYDARLETPGWDAPGADHADWSSGVCTTPPTGETELSAQEAPPVRVQETLTAVSRREVAPGVWLYDLGRNIAGFPQVSVRDSGGETLRLAASERLADGRVTRAGLHPNAVYFEFTPADDARTTWHPRFTYDGFRWIEVSGVSEPPATSDVKALVLHADNDRAGSFESSEPMLNQIHELVLRAVESNMYSELTDCPHREKFGWNEEKHLLFETVAANFEVGAYYRQIVRNVMDGQWPNGDIPRLTPNHRNVAGWDPWWSSVIIHAPWKLYRAYADLEILQEAYPAMRRYLDYLQGQADGAILENETGYGDWGAADPSTPKALTGTVGYYRAADTLSEIATVLGDGDAAAAYADLADDIKAAFHARFFDPATASYGSASQASNALPLAAGMVPAEHRAAVLDRIVGDIRSRGDHLSTGEIGLRALLDALGDGGRAGTVLDMTLNATVPNGSGVDVASGYAAMVLGTPVPAANADGIPWTGQTTLTEGWNPTGASRNHFMLGAIDDWLYRYLAGITPDAPGFRRFTVAPQPAGALSHVRAAWSAPYGRIVSEWRRYGETFRLDVEVPVNTTATVAVPFADKGKVVATGGAELVRVDGDRAYYAVGSGRYSFFVDTGTRAETSRIPVYVGKVTREVRLPTDPTWSSNAEFRLHNRGDRAVTVRPDLTVPAGFNASPDARSVRIPARGSVPVNVSVGVAEPTVAGGSLSLRVEDSEAAVPLTTIQTDNLVRVATMTASSSHARHPTTRANDGDISSDTWDAGNGWNDGTQSLWPDWLAATWNRPVTLSRVKVYTLDSRTYPAASYGLKDFDVQLLVDGQWTTMQSYRDNTAGVVETGFDPVTTTAVRVFVHEGRAGWSRVIELEGYR